VTEYHETPCNVEICHPVIGSGARPKRSPPHGGPVGRTTIACGKMSAFEYEQEEDEMPERVGIVTGGASGIPPGQLERHANRKKALVWRWRPISHKRDGNSLL
jgi:hypothetical protein